MHRIHIEGEKSPISCKYLLVVLGRRADWRIPLCRLGIDIGALIKQDSARVHCVGIGTKMERRESSLVCHTDILQ